MRRLGHLVPGVRIAWLWVNSRAWASRELVCDRIDNRILPSSPAMVAARREPQLTPSSVSVSLQHPAPPSQG